MGDCEAAARAQDKQDQQMFQKYSNALVKNGVPGMQDNFDELFAHINQFTSQGKSVPGLGGPQQYIAGKAPFLSGILPGAGGDDAVKTNMLKTNVLNWLTLQMAGKAVSKQEEARQIKATLDNPLATESQQLDALDHAARVFGATRADILRQLPADKREQFQENAPLGNDYFAPVPQSIRAGKSGAAPGISPLGQSTRLPSVLPQSAPTGPVTNPMTNPATSQYYQ